MGTAMKFTTIMISPPTLKCCPETPKEIFLDQSPNLTIIFIRACTVFSNS